MKKPRAARTLGAVRALGPSALLLAPVALVASCRSTPPPSAPATEVPAARPEPEIDAPRTGTGVSASHSSAPAPPPPSWSLPADWDRGTTLAFERAIEGWLPRDQPRRLSPKDLLALAAALDRGDEPAVRAAVLLARTHDPSAGDALVQRLEKRLEPAAGAQTGDAADVIAAAALAGRFSARDAGPPLEGLAIGSRPHPDLEARVECGCSALALGKDSVIPFLLRVLREGTTAGTSPVDWKPKGDLDWAQWRAAEALSARAGVPCRFRPEASVKAREQEAARLEALLPKAEARRKR